MHREILRESINRDLKVNSGILGQLTALFQKDFIKHLNWDGEHIKNGCQRTLKDFNMVLIALFILINQECTPKLNLGARLLVLKMHFL